jgi:hypothetical protein
MGFRRQLFIRFIVAEASAVSLIISLLAMQLGQKLLKAFQ